MFACRCLHSNAGKGILLLAAVLLSSGAVSAADATRVPKPVLEAGQGEKCVENTEFMRKNHMELLKHQRDETMHQGIRTRKYSLNGCIECHASRKTNSVVGSEQNFCQSCHSYVAVKLDCFECHSSKPKPPAHKLTGAVQRSARQDVK
ncbi:MAG: hypothetical protein Q8K18_02715 [Burkholderiales bacterium]|nr:hypothetical protein [Burkholderiales bacterium]